MPSASDSPMMKQYLRIKADHQDAVLLFHLGDFYEAFFDDAELVSRELDIVLTSRNGYPMAGVPIRRGDAYIAELLKHGHKVAVCQQVEDPKKARSLVKREVVRVVTPGTTIDDAVLDAGANNYLASVLIEPDSQAVGLAFLDLSTGQFDVTRADVRTSLRGELVRRGPSEVLVGDSALARVAELYDRSRLTQVEDAWFSASAFPVEALGEDELGLRAGGAILAYVEQTQRSLASHVRAPRRYEISDHMDLDPFTITSLELVKPLRAGQERGTLFHVLDQTMTGMGRRRLRAMILAPWVDRERIEDRLDAVGILVHQSLERAEARNAIRQVHDLERLTGKLGARRMGPLDLLRLQTTLERIPEVASALARLSPDRVPAGLVGIRTALDDPQLIPLATRLSGMLIDQPPADARDGGMIREGFNEDLDHLRSEVRGLRDRLATLEQDERARTGIASLKVGYNRVFGYYLEVTRPHLDKVPEEYVRRQTLANAERFITEELQGLEEKIARGEERAKSLEAQLYAQVIEDLIQGIPILQGVADALAELDLLQSLAETAHRYAYVRPVFTERHEIDVRAGRHPVVERIEEFVPNDLCLSEGEDLVILTGPNMAGKSVYLRQAAIVCLMAQIGSFVPADRAILPIVDRVFARVGASDMLVEGISTFMMEMLEVAAILDRATSRSLIILDEMGRGTSTFDGVSIAWAVARELATRVRAKTLFATHYQELTRLADEVGPVVNYHVAVKEVGRDVVFLHRVEPGIAAGSYGVHVARLAGLPNHVTDAADRILEDLLREAPLSRLGAAQETAEPLALFGAEDHPVIQRLRRLDPDQITPLEALRILADLKERIDD